MFNLYLAQFKREFWEHKTVMFKVPLIAASVAIISMLIMLLYFPSIDSKTIYVQADGDLHISFDNSNSGYSTHSSEVLLDSSQIDTLENWQAVEQDFPQREIQKKPEMQHLKAEDLAAFQTWSLGFSALVISVFLISMLVSSFSADRKDSSILFWRSLPIPESRNVVVKYLNAYLGLTFIYLAITLLASLIILSMFAVFESYISPATDFIITPLLWSLFWAFASGCLYLFFIVFWLSPIFAWIGLAASYPNRNFTLVAIVPLLLISLVEWIIFSTKTFSTSIIDYIDKGMDSVSYLAKGEFGQVDFGLFAIGLVVSVLFTIATIYMRKWRID